MGFHVIGHHCWKSQCFRHSRKSQLDCCADWKQRYRLGQLEGLGRISCATGLPNRYSSWTAACIRKPWFSVLISKLVCSILPPSAPLALPIYLSSMLPNTVSKISLAYYDCCSPLQCFRFLWIFFVDTDGSGDNLTGQPVDALNLRCLVMSSSL